jgi:hypothetical protein
MTSLIQPICYPQPYPDEAPMGYLIRVCEANQFNNVRWLYPEEGEQFVHLPKDILARLVESPWSGFSEFRDKLQPYIDLRKVELNYTVLRYCPQCLDEDPYYRIGWQVRSSVACAKHQCWLLDTCSDCGKQQLLSSRSTINQCTCSKTLSSNPSTKVPDSVIRYQQFIDGETNFLNGDNFWLTDAFNELNLPLQHRVELTHFFAHWQPIECNRFDKTGSFTGFSEMGVAKAYATSLAEAYFNSAEEFRVFMDRIHHHVYPTQEEGDKLFKRFYRHFFLYCVGDVEPLYEEFSNYLNHNWRHPLSHKNTLFSESTLENHNWLALQTVSKRYDLPKSELERAVNLGLIRSEKKHFEDSDRTFTYLFIADVHKYLTKASNQVNGVTAASIMGVTKKQFYQLVDSHYLAGKAPSKESGSTWTFNREHLHSLLDRFTKALPVVEDEYIPFPEALRKVGNRIDHPIVAILEAIESEVIKTRRKSQLIGLRSLYVSEQDLMAWYHRKVNEERSGLYTMSQLARSMCVSTELIKQLIERRLLQSFKRGEKESRYIPAKSVDEFKERFVLLTKLSKQSGLDFHEIRPLFEAHKIKAIDHELPKEERYMNRIFYRYDLVNVKEISSLVGAMGDWDFMV